MKNVPRWLQLERMTVPDTEQEIILPRMSKSRWKAYNRLYRMARRRKIRRKTFLFIAGGVLGSIPALVGGIIMLSGGPFYWELFFVGVALITPELAMCIKAIREYEPEPVRRINEKRRIQEWVYARETARALAARSPSA